MMKHEPPFTTYRLGFFDRHNGIRIGAKYFGAMAGVLAALAITNNALQPQEWKDDINRQVVEDGFSGANYSFLPEPWQRTTARTTLTYQACTIEGVTLSLHYDNDKVSDVTAYDFSTAEDAIETGVVPRTMRVVANAEQLAAKLSLQKCIG